MLWTKQGSKPIHIHQQSTRSMSSTPNPWSPIDHDKPLQKEVWSCIHEEDRGASVKKELTLSVECENVLYLVEYFVISITLQFIGELIKSNLNVSLIASWERLFESEDVSIWIMFLFLIVCRLVWKCINIFFDSLSRHLNYVRLEVMTSSFYWILEIADHNFLGVIRLLLQRSV